MRITKENQTFSLLIIALAGWFIPGAGHFLINEKKRAVIIFLSIVITFGIGIYVGSIGVIDTIESKAWYCAQIMNSPLVALIARKTAAGGYPVYGKPNEIGQIYTSISGLLNLLCLINAVYLAHLTKGRQDGGQNVSND